MDALRVRHSWGFVYEANHGVILLFIARQIAEKNAAVERVAEAMLSPAHPQHSAWKKFQQLHNSFGLPQKSYSIVADFGKEGLSIDSLR